MLTSVLGALRYDYGLHQSLLGEPALAVIAALKSVKAPSQNGYGDVVKVLLQAGATVNAAGEKGRTPLTLANMNGHMM